MKHEKHFAMRIIFSFFKSLFYHLKLHESLNICQENDNRLLNSEVGNVHNTVKLRKSAVVPRMDKKKLQVSLLNVVQISTDYIQHLKLLVPIRGEVTYKPLI